MATPAANLLWPARQAVCTAIDEYGPLKGVFKSKFYFEPSGSRARTSEERPDLHREPTAVIECPAIKIRPAGLLVRWQFNGQQRLPFSVGWEIWSDSLRAADIEALVGHFIDAIHVSKAAGLSARDAGYVRAAIGAFPIFESMTFSEVSLGDEPDNDTPVLKASGLLTLPLNYQPTTYVNGQ